MPPIAARLQFEMHIATIKAHYGITDDEVKTMIRRCYQENPLNRRNLADYGSIEVFRKAIPVLRGHSKQKSGSDYFGSMYQ